MNIYVRTRRMSSQTPQVFGTLEDAMTIWGKKRKFHRNGITCWRWEDRGGDNWMIYERKLPIPEEPTELVLHEGVSGFVHVRNKDGTSSSFKVEAASHRLWIYQDR